MTYSNATKALLDAPDGVFEDSGVRAVSLEPEASRGLVAAGTTDGAPRANDADELPVPTLHLYDRGVVAHFTDDALLSQQAQLAELRRRVDTNLSLLADEVARRSHHSLGHDGLAQRLGSRTPQNLVQRVTGTSAREAATLVRVGSMLAESAAESAAHSALDSAANSAADSSEPTRPGWQSSPWLQSVSFAVESARLSIDAGDAIARGLGRADEHVTAQQLASAAEQLVAEAAVLTLEQLAVRARNARALLDLEAQPSQIDDREQGLRDRRYLYLSRQADGMTRLNGLLDPESAALVRDAVDAATSPRRGGPRFVSDDERERAERLLRDTRTTEQLALDSLVELVRLGGEVAPSALIGVRAPSVQVIVTERDLHAGHGLARLEGQTEPVSVATARRHACATGIAPIVIDTRGDVVALGRESRLYTRRQRIALAARDGGCRFPGCDRPPSWTEAHHIIPWSEGGATDLDTGVLLCRHHHLLLHNNDWRFVRAEHDLVLIPPRTIDPNQRPIPAPSKNPLIERVRRAGAQG